MLRKIRSTFDDPPQHQRQLMFAFNNYECTRGLVKKAFPCTTGSVFPLRKIGPLRRTRRLQFRTVSVGNELRTTLAFHIFLFFAALSATIFHILFTRQHGIRIGL